MIHYPLTPINPDDNDPLGADAGPDTMDDDWPGPPPTGNDSQIPLWMHNWDIVRADVDDVGFSQLGWKMLLDKLQHAYNCHCQRTRTPRGI